MTSIVLFDFGGVVIRTPFELADASWRGPFDPTTDPLWRRFQAGQISERAYWHTRAAEVAPDADDPLAEFMDRLYDTAEERVVRPQLPPLLDRLDEAGLMVAVLTNDLRAFHSDAWVERITVLSRFDPVIDLSHAGVLKPAVEAFEYATKMLDVHPAEVVFCDDQPANVAGAAAHGYRSVWFDPTDVETSLARLWAEVQPPS